MRELAKYKLEKFNQNSLPRAKRNNCCTFIYIIDYLCSLTIIYDFFQPIFIAFLYGFKYKVLHVIKLSYNSNFSQNYCMFYGNY